MKKNLRIRFVLKMKRLSRLIFIILLLMIGLVIFANVCINRRTRDFVYSDVNAIPSNKAGLLLGTAKYLKSGQINQFFENRIVAAVELYKAGKINKIVISGDNSRSDYNEPQDIKDELVKRGVKAGDIYLDFAGFRTYDSVYRMYAIFGQQSFTIISQEFHNRRALYIASSLGLDAVGYNAAEVSDHNSFKTKVREKFARVKVLLDFAFGGKPKFLGEKIVIE